MPLYYFIVAVALIGGLFFLRNKTLQRILLILFNLLQWGFTVYECFHFNEVQLGYFTVDGVALIMLIVLSILSTTSSYHSVDFLEHHHKNHTTPQRAKSIYLSAFCLLILAQTGAFLSSHIAGTWIFVELTTFAASVLIYHDRTEYAIEAAWKYLFVCSIAITFAFIGILFLSISAQEAGTTDLSYQSLIQLATSFNPFWLKLAFLFILVGYSAKMGLFPMHTVCIDAHTVAPPPISAFISTTLMNVGFTAIFRSYTIVASTSILPWANNILLIAGALSVFVAAVYLLRVNHFKRMSAYSSLENMGIVAVGLGAGGIGYYAVILHLIFHSFTKASIFYQIQQVYRVYQSYLIRNTGGYFKIYTAGAMVMLLSFICITAMPPSGMFVSEFMIFRALFAKHYIGLLILILFLLTLAMWALSRNFFRLIYAPPVGFDFAHAENISMKESVSQFILLGLVIYLGFNPPQQMVDLINEAIKNLPH
ncbi:MAG TPA: proton-conducting transporter membrane subunit [Chitinophagales bacterium]|nr:proton-conducting transporter membrane subunit [Chitinophagales bacterium]